jgi:hypothetical protein
MGRTSDMRGDRIAEAGSKGNARGPPSSSVRAFALADWQYCCTLGESGGGCRREPSRPFEFAVLNDPGLARDADPAAFAEHFRGRSGSDVLSFPNIGGDAIMVVPRPLAPPSTYAHLATFVRNAPESQRHALWKSVGDAMSRRLSARPVWLSTAGAGVPWLHVRLDDRPKYYGFTPYRDPRA